MVPQIPHEGHLSSSNLPHLSPLARPATTVRQSRVYLCTRELIFSAHTSTCDGITVIGVSPSDPVPSWSNNTPTSIVQHSGAASCLHSTPFCRVRCTRSLRHSLILPCHFRYPYFMLPCSSSEETREDGDVGGAQLMIEVQRMRA